MREHLLGYLLGALDGPEHQQVQQHLEQDPRLQEELKSLEAHVDFLRHDSQWDEPPRDLAERTCALVEDHCRRREPAPLSGQYGTTGAAGRWTMADFVVAAGIFLAASLLFWPAIAHSHRQARSAACQNNLRQLGSALQRYVNDHDRYYPRIPIDGKLAAAGLVGPILRDGELLENQNWLLCPGSELARRRDDFYVPTCDELQQSEGPQLAKLKQNMGGSFAFNLGYIEQDVYFTPRHAARPNFAVISDAPGDGPQRQSGNHGRWGQNVLFDDFHVQYIRGCLIESCGDEFFVNRNGQVAAGLDVDDSVLAGSATAPLIRPVKVAPLPQP